MDFPITGIDGSPDATGTIASTQVPSLALLKMGYLNVKDSHGGSPAAVGDGVRFTDVTVNSSTTISRSGGFSGATAGMKGTIRFGGASAVDHSFTVVSTAGNNMTITPAAGATLSNAWVTYGTDDTEAFIAAQTACAAQGGGTILVPAGQYIIAGALKTVDNRNDAGANPHAQIPFHYTSNQTATRGHIKWLGESIPSCVTLGLDSDIPRPTSGTWLISTIGGNHASAAVFGGAPTNYTQFTFENIQVAVRPNPSGVGVTMHGIFGLETASCSFINCCVVADSSLYNLPEPQGDFIGICTNRKEMEAMSYVENCMVWGMGISYMIQEHATVGKIFGAGYRICLLLGGSGQAFTIRHPVAHWGVTAVQLLLGTLWGVDGGGQTFLIDIVTIEERGPYNKPWMNRGTDIVGQGVSNAIGQMCVHVNSTTTTTDTVSMSGIPDDVIIRDLKGVQIS